MKKFLLILVVFTLILIACQSQSSYRQVRSQNSGSSSSPSETPSGSSPSPSSVSPIKEQLQHYLQNPPPSKITYDLRTTLQDPEGTHTVTGTQVVALRGKDLKLQTQTDTEGQSFNTITYVIQGRYYACQMEQEWACYEFPQPEQDPTPQIQQSIRDDLDKLDVQDGGQRILLGKNTQCYKLLFQDPQSQENGETTYCYDPEGALLYSHTSTTDFESSLEATDHTPSNDADFQLPAEAKPIDEPVEN
ncbi:MAG TPA: hypothetical protein VJG90_07810 [Candidatus Nanoarchaeia archaeon]|nr:hypothetical protein [Candidatus Nanoarchaeia archaeon]